MPGQEENAAQGGQPGLQGGPIAVDTGCTLGHFDVTGDPSGVGQRWKRWKRAFKLYIVGKGVTDDKQKQALLLHMAGLGVQEIFFTLVEEDAVKTYAETETLLKDYFEPKANIPFERHQFRQTLQGQDTVDQWVCRLRQQAANCDYGNGADEQIRDHIIDKCNSQVLRRKFLERADLSLNDLLTIARAHEAVDRQVKAMEKPAPAQINSIRQKQHRPPSSPSQGSLQAAKVKECFGCGQVGHFVRDKKCPARKHRCESCGYVGHFQSKCRSTGAKSNGDSQNSQIRSNKKKRRFGRRNQGAVRQVQEDTSEEEYVFSVKPHGGDDTVEVLVGGKPIRMVLDTGSKKNIIDEGTFRTLPSGITRSLSETSVKLYPYGSKVPLKVLGKFSATISVDGKTQSTVMYVVPGSCGNLLSRQSAIDLGIVTIVQTVGVSPADDLLKEYQDRFVGIGRLKGFKVKLHTKPDVKPVIQPHRRIPFSLRKKVEDKLAELERNDIIEPVTGPTPWVSPIVCVPKPKNPSDIRICVDMRAVNKAIERERHITPTLEELIAEVSGAKYYSKLDLNQGYHQLELDEESRNLTCFSTHVGLRRYKRLNFGVNSASEIFQNAISQVLDGIKGAINISDDILIYAKETTEEHDQILRAVMERLREKNITLNRDKCVFRKEKISFFGHIWTSQGVKPDPKKVEAVVNAEEPKNASEVRSFLGTVNYMSRFVPDMATVSEPLRALTKKDVPWKWGPAESRAFNHLKKCLTEADVMAYFKPEEECTLVVDASPIGLGAILMQNGKVVSYASRSLGDVEQRYSQTEREALAIKWSCDHFRLYLYGREVTVVTDHKPLEAIFNNPYSKPPPRIERWLVKLQDFLLRVKYSPGKDNPADYMSRHPVPSADTREESASENHINFIMTHSTPAALTIEQVREATDQDETLVKVREIIGTGKWYQLLSIHEGFQPFWRVRDELSVSSDGVVLRGNRIVIPVSLQQHVTKLAHIGHQGIAKTKALMRTKVWFPGIDERVESEIQGCLSCQACAAPSKREPLKMSVCPDQPWTHVSVDFCGPIQPAGEYILVVVDEHSRFPEVEIVHSTSARAAIPKLDKIFATHGIPKVVKTDNGPPFNSEDFSMFAKYLGFTHRKITPYWPEANGEAERFMKTLKKALRTSTAEGKPWRQELWRFMRQYRATPHVTTKVSPAKALFRRELDTELPSVRDLVDINAEKLKDRDQWAKARMKSYADQRRKTSCSDIVTGDRVLYRNPNPGKLDTPYFPQPLTVVKRHGDMITATNGDNPVTRNVSRFRKFSEHKDIQDTTTCDKEHNAEATAEPSQGRCEPGEIDEPQEVVGQPPGTPILRRSARQVKKPERFKDFV